VDSNGSPPDHRPSRPFAAQKKAEHVPGRSVVRTIRDLDAEAHRAAGQDTPTDQWRFHPFLHQARSTASRPTTPTAGTQIIEPDHAALKRSALAHLPTGVVTANAAWLVLPVLASTSTSGRRTGCGRTRTHVVGPTAKYGRSKASLVSAGPVFLSLECLVTARCAESRRLPGGRGRCAAGPLGTPVPPRKHPTEDAENWSLAPAVLAAPTLDSASTLHAIAQSEFAEHVVTWDLTVVSLRKRALAISALERPRAMSMSTASSRSVRDLSSCGLVAPGRGRPTSRRTSRSVIAGASNVSPAATTRTASASCSGRTSLSRNPLAPGPHGGLPADRRVAESPSRRVADEEMSGRPRTVHGQPAPVLPGHTRHR
jgi:hypothetical protein